MSAPSERIEKIVEAIKNKTKQENSYALIIKPERTPNITDSKFGGVPYWNLDMPYPTDPDGKNMILLAQINFDNAKVDFPLPQKGMLQFFIAVDDCYGLDFDEPNKQNKFRVVYHENIDKTVTKEQLIEKGIPDATDENYEYATPVYEEVAVDIEKKNGYIGNEDYNFEDVFLKTAQEICGEDMEKYESIYDFLTEEEGDYVYDEFENNGHRLLGYPYFTQSDPRWDEEMRVYDTLLFQMDSEMNNNGKDYVLWGDVGVGNFFINRKKLEECDFSDVLYNWDCC